MPIKKTTYWCQFRCGSKAMPLKKMIEHEEKCWKNPKTKTCFTCKNGSMEIDGDDDFQYLNCKFKEVENFVNDEDYLLIKGHKTAKYSLIEPVVNCPFYNSDNFKIELFHSEIEKPIIEAIAELEKQKEEQKQVEDQLDGMSF